MKRFLLLAALTCGLTSSVIAAPPQPAVCPILVDRSDSRLGCKLEPAPCIGVKITLIRKDAAVNPLGLAVGDVIYKINGETLRTVEDFDDAIESQIRSGCNVISLDVWHGEKHQTIYAKMTQEEKKMKEMICGVEECWTVKQIAFSQVTMK